jgi:hypothetical protein
MTPRNGTTVRLGAALGLLALALALALVACTTPAPRPGVGPPSPVTPPMPAPASTAALAAAIAADAKRSDHEPNPRARTELALDATRAANDCLALAPAAAACLYGNALALGLEARVHPTRAGELLKDMLESLGRAGDADATYDDAGPARVRALVLLKAPGWPLGPGDPEAGLAAARQAVALRPGYPPNQLALAEALARNQDATAARAAYQSARAAALAAPASTDRDEWIREADTGLRH